MKRSTYQKFMKAGISTVLVASVFVATPISEVSANKDSGKDPKKDNGKGSNPTPKVDKTSLLNTINSVSNLKKGDYTVDSWNNLQQALSAAQKVVNNSKATQSDVTKALNNLNTAIKKLVVNKQPTVAKVTSFKELKTAINNPKIKGITIVKNIKLEDKLKITSEKHIIGNGYTLTGVTSKKGNDSYALEFSKTVGSVTNLKITGADAAINVEDSTVTLNGKIDVSGNQLGGIILGKAKAKTQMSLHIGNATIVNQDEANDKPTIVEEQIESTDVPHKVVGFEGMHVDYNEKSTKHLQRFYYLNSKFSAPNPIKPFTLSLMHSNDTHANLNQIAKKVTAVKEVRAAKPKALLIDAGDVFSGTLYFNEYKGQADLAFMNLMGYDIMTFGNHEFDLGSSPEGHKALVDFIEGAKFPFISSNIDFSKDTKFKGLFSDLISSKPKDGEIYSGIVKEIDGEKVGFFGLTTEETSEISSPGSIVFENYIQEAKKAVKAFEGMGVNKIVALTHIGYDDNPAIDNDLNLAEMVEGIDVIVGGHSHTQLAEPRVVDEDGTPTVIVQAYQYNEYLGTLDVEFDKKGVVVRHNGELIKIADKVEDPKAANLLQPYKARVDEVAAQETGAIAVKALENLRTTLDSVRRNETPLGNLITDGMLQKAKSYDANVIMAFQNGGGIRAGINEGPITIGEVITVLPFGNTLATMNLTGFEIKQTFETSLKELPLENGGFLHVSGAKVEYDSSKSAGERVVSIKYKDATGTYQELVDNTMYTIATNAFTAKGGDGFTVLAKAYSEGRVKDLGLSDWENFRDHLISLGNVEASREGRIVDVVGRVPEIPGGPVGEADFSGTPENPKVYSGDVTLNISNGVKLTNAIVKGNLIITGTLPGALSLEDIDIKGDLDLTGLDAKDIKFKNVKVDGETLF